MDESWRMQMGLSAGLPRRRSMEDRSSARTRRSIFTGDSPPETLDPDDFTDVFGGPPRSLLAHKSSRPGSFYEEIFQPPELRCHAPAKGGRSLTVFRIPAKKEAFYSDIFGSDYDRISRERLGSLSMAKSKSNSSSALSSEEPSPLRPAIGDDVALSAFVSKLRPINVPCRWNSSTMKPKENCKRVSSPETISLASNSYQSLKATDDFELGSPFSAVSGRCQEPDAKSSVHDRLLPELVIKQDVDDDYYDDDDEAMSSYVIDFNSNLREEHCGTDQAIDEAIAWAKEKFQSRNSVEESTLRNEGNEQTTAMEGRAAASEYHNEAIGIVTSPKTETEKLDRDINLWSSGKETDIRILLSTLHHILWPESGWYAVPIMSLIQSSQVRKAYQKARLCLHPDKLQQRGATLMQKYIADKAFSILQDAWTAFISQDVSF